jgi:hypothetical protein
MEAVSSEKEDLSTFHDSRTKSAASHTDPALVKPKQKKDLNL